MESILPQGSTALWVCQEVFRFLLSKVFDLFALILYWYDISSDILLAIKFKENCHYWYLWTSITIMCHSLWQSICASGEHYVLPKMTASERKKIRMFKPNCSWASTIKRSCKGIIHGIPFPIQLINLSLKMLVYGNEGMTEQDKLHLFIINFSEGIRESMPQLMLSFYVILQHGLEDQVQVASILGSSLSLLYCFSMKYAYLKYSHYPTKKEIFIAGLNNIIPIILFYAGQFVELTILISSQNLGSFLIFVKLLFITIVFYLQFYDIKHHTIKKIAKFFTCSRTVLIFYFVTTVIHTKKTITQSSFIFENSTWLQQHEKNETNVFLKPFNNCDNVTLEQNFEPYQMNVVEGNLVLSMYLMWFLLVIGIVNESRKDVNSPNISEFLSNTELLKLLEEIDKQNKSDIGNEDIM